MKGKIILMCLVLLIMLFPLCLAVVLTPSLESGSSGISLISTEAEVQGPYVYPSDSSLPILSNPRSLLNESLTLLSNQIEDEDNLSSYEITSCGVVLDNEGATYTLVNDVHDYFYGSDKPCILIGADYITLDFNGHELIGVEGKSGNGVVSLGFNNLIIRSGEITQFNHGIDLEDSNFNEISDMTFENNYEAGVYLEDSSDNLIEENIFSDNGFYGIRLGGDRNELNDNEIQQDRWGIMILGDENVLKNNEISDTYYLGGSIYFTEGSSNIVSGGVISGFESAGVVLMSGSTNNLFKDIIFRNPGYCSTVPAVLFNINTFDNVFLNATYPYVFEKANSWQGQTGELTREWYYQAYVSDMNGNPIEGAVVSGKGTLPEQEFSLITDESGKTPLTGIFAYTYRNGGYTPYPFTYTVSAEKEDYAESSHLLYFYGNKYSDAFVLEPSYQIIDSCQLTLNENTLNQSNTEYRLNSDLDINSRYKACLRVSSPNITIDCQGYSIYNSYSSTSSYALGIVSNQPGTIIKNCKINAGTRGAGIYLAKSDDSKLINNSLFNQAVGIRLDNSQGVLIEDNKLSSNNIYGVYLNRVENSEIKENDFNENFNGLKIAYSSSNLISGNRVAFSKSDGVSMSYSFDNKVLNNIITSNKRGIVLSSDTQSSLRGKKSNSQLNEFSFNYVCDNSNKDFFCTRAGAVGTGNSFGGKNKIVECRNGQTTWPVYPKDYSYC